MYTLSGCFVKNTPEPLVDSFQVYDGIQLTINDKLGKTLFFKREITQIHPEQWLRALTKACGYRKIRDDYFFGERLAAGSFG